MYKSGATPPEFPLESMTCKIRLEPGLVVSEEEGDRKDVKIGYGPAGWLTFHERLFGSVPIKEVVVVPLASKARM